MKLITDQYQYIDWPISVACNVMMNLKWDEVMTIIGLIFKRIEFSVNPK